MNLKNESFLIFETGGSTSYKIQIKNFIVRVLEKNKVNAQIISLSDFDTTIA